MRRADSSPSALFEDILAFCMNAAAQMIDGAKETTHDPRQRSKKDVIRDILLSKLDLITAEQYHVLKDQITRLNQRIATLEETQSPPKKPNHSPKEGALRATKESNKKKPAEQKKSKSLPSVKQQKKPTKRSKESKR